MSHKQELTPWQDDSTLRYLYHDKEKTTYEIADLFGVHHSTVLRQMEKSGIDRRQNGWQTIEYSEDELIEWVDSFVRTFGVVPIEEDLHGWPGPSPTPYQRCFGTFTEAVRQAGYTPRSEQ